MLKKSNERESFSKIRTSLRESAEYSSSNNSSLVGSNGAANVNPSSAATNTTSMHMTRIPPQMRPGLNQRAYQF
jgi:hypothetical protein